MQLIAHILVYKSRKDFSILLSLDLCALIELGFKSRIHNLSLNNTIKRTTIILYCEIIHIQIKWKTFFERNVVNQTIKY